MGAGTNQDQLTVPPERVRLIEAMARSCVKRGYSETRVADVVAEAGLEREDFERLFVDTAECATAAIEMLIGEALSVSASAFSADTSEWESALQVLSAQLELLSARPALAELLMIDSRQTMEPEAARRYESGLTLCAAMVDRLRANREGDCEPPPSAARAALGGGEALVRREIAAGRAESLPEILPDVVYSCTVAFLGQEEALRLARRGREMVAARGYSPGR